MTTSTVISNALVAVGAKPFASTMQALRDNIAAGLECDPTAPVNAACWHPYDMVYGNDGAIGRFYNGAVVASVAAPTMELGWDYLFRGIGLSHNDAGTPRSFLVNGVDAIGSTLAHTVTVNFSFEITAPMVTDWPKIQQNGVRNVSSGGGNAGLTGASFFTNNATGLSTFNFSWSAGSIDAGQLFMYRRRNYMP
jgi:hypothetical protein